MIERKPISVASAEKKWCPFARVTLRSDEGELTSSFNRCMVPSGTTFVPSGSLCITAGCMAWEQASEDFGWCKAFPGV